MTNNMVSLETEIRKLRPANLCTFAELLSPHLWKTLMGNIKKPGSQNVLMFTGEHIAMIETAAIKQCKSASEIFLHEWATMGRERPTIRTAIDLLVEIELFRAADYLAIKIIGGIAPKRPTEGPAAAIQIPIEIVGKYNQQDGTANKHSHHYRYPIGTMANHHVNTSVNSHCSNSDVCVNETQFSEASTKNYHDIAKHLSDRTHFIEFSYHDMITEKNENENEERPACESNPANNVNHFTHQSASFLPNFSALKLDSIEHPTIQENSSLSNLPNYPQELLSSQLPLCINNRAAMSSHQQSSCEVHHSIIPTNSSGSLTSISDNNGHCNFHQMPIGFNQLIKSKSLIQVNDSSQTNFVHYNELPLTVVELCQNPM